MKKLIAAILILLLTVPTTVSAASSLLIVKDGKTSKYTGQQLKVICNGKNVSLTNTPGILENDIAMLPYYDVFRTSLQVSTSYNATKKTITFVNGKNKVVLTVNSKQAIVNGKSKTVNQAPKIVKYVAANKSKVLVPSRFVAENLGISYQWNSKTGTVTLKNASKPAASTNSFPIKYLGKNYTYNKEKVTINAANNVIKTAMPGLWLQDTLFVPAYSVFHTSGLKADYNYNSSTKSLTISNSEHNIVLGINSKVAYVDGKKQTIPLTPRVIQLVSNKKNYIMVPVEYVANALGYKVLVNKTTNTVTITTTSSGNSGSNQNIVTQEEGTIFSATPTKTLIPDSVRYLDQVKFEDTGDYKEPSAITDISKQDMNHYLITFDSPVSGVSFTNLESEKLSITVNNCITNNEKYPIGELLVSDVDAYQDYSDDNNAKIVFNLNVNKASYRAVLSKDRTSIQLEIIENYLNSIEIDKDTTMDTVKLTSLSKTKPTVNLDSSKKKLTITMDKTDTVFNKINQDLDGYQISNINLNSDNHQVTIVLSLKEESYYKVSTSGTSTIVTVTTFDSSVDSHVQIKTPSQIDMSKVVVRQDNQNLQYIVTIPGDQSEYYMSNQPTMTNTQGNTIKGVDIVINGEGNTDIVVTTTVVQKFTLSKDSGVINIKVTNPD